MKRLGCLHNISKVVFWVIPVSNNFVIRLICQAARAFSLSTFLPSLEVNYCFLFGMRQQLHDIIFECDCFCVWVIALEDSSMLGDQKFLKVPGDIISENRIPTNEFRWQKRASNTTTALLQPGIERNFVLSVHFNLGHNWEVRDIIVSRTYITQAVEDL